MNANEKNGKIGADAAESKIKAAEAKAVRDGEVSRKTALKEKRRAEELQEKSRAEEKASALAQAKGAKEAAKLLQRLAQTAKAMVETKCQVYQKTKSLYENALYTKNVAGNLHTLFADGGAPGQPGNVSTCDKACKAFTSMLTRMQTDFEQLTLNANSLKNKLARHKFDEACSGSDYSAATPDPSLSLKNFSAAIKTQKMWLIQLYDLRIDTGSLQLAAASAHGASVASGSAGAAMAAVYDSSQATLKAAGAANSLQASMIKMVRSEFNATGTVIAQQLKINAKDSQLSRRWKKMSLSYQNAALEVGIATEKVAKRQAAQMKEVMETSYQAARSSCEQDEYSSCHEVLKSSCPNGVYKIRPFRTLYHAYCKQGHEYRATGCDPGWAALPGGKSGNCYRLFVPNGPTGGKGKRNQLNIDEDFAVYDVARQHCLAHGARLGGYDITDDKSVIMDMGWQENSNRTKAGVAAVWIGAVTIWVDNTTEHVVSAGANSTAVNRSYTKKRVMKSYKRAVLTELSELQEMESDFKSGFICHKQALSETVQFGISACTASSSLDVEHSCSQSTDGHITSYWAPSADDRSPKLSLTFGEDTRKAADGEAAQSLAAVNRVSISLRQNSTAIRTRMLQLKFSDGVTRVIKLRETHNAMPQTVSFEMVKTRNVTVTWPRAQEYFLSGLKNEPAEFGISQIKFWLDLGVHFLPVSSCTASSSLPTQPCKNVYDGTNMWWGPTIGSVVGSWIRVNFRNSQLVNRMAISFRIGKGTPRASRVTLEFASGPAQVFSLLKTKSGHNQTVAMSPRVTPWVKVHFGALFKTGSSEPFGVSKIQFWRSQAIQSSVDPSPTWEYTKTMPECNHDDALKYDCNCGDKASEFCKSKGQYVGWDGKVYKKCQKDKAIWWALDDQQCGYVPHDGCPRGWKFYTATNNGETTAKCCRGKCEDGKEEDPVLGHPAPGNSICQIPTQGDNTRSGRRLLWEESDLKDVKVRAPDGQWVTATHSPSTAPTESPTPPIPTPLPTTYAPSSSPTGSPSVSPSVSPSAAPTTHAPTSSPSFAPSAAPSVSPTGSPTTAAPTSAPSDAPTHSPTQTPTKSPTKWRPPSCEEFVKSSRIFLEELQQQQKNAQYPMPKPFHGGAEFLNAAHTCQTGRYTRDAKCEGLTPAGHITASECQHKCCEDVTCSVWQWHQDSGCFIGDASSCSHPAEVLLEQGGVESVGWHGQLIDKSRGGIQPYGERPFRLVHLGTGHGFGYSNSPPTLEEVKGLVLAEERALWLHNWSEDDDKALILATMKAMGFFSDAARAIRLAAQKVAMGLCLAGLAIGKFVVSVGGAIVSGLANFVIMALEAAIKAMGPKFFEIMNLEISGGFDVMSGGDIAFGFAIDMWLANFRITWGFHVEFNLGKIIVSLFKKLASALSDIF